MSYLSKPAFVVDRAEGWKHAEHREHPVIDWMYDYEREFDEGDMKKTGPAPWHHDDLVFTHPSGRVFNGSKESWEGLLGFYAPLAAHYHEPDQFIVWETDRGYKLNGIAKVYTNLLVPGEKKHKDLTGRAWDTVGNGGFTFEFIKDPSGPKGLKIIGHTLCGDGLGLFSEMVDRKMCTTDEVFALYKKIVSG
jgi:hypothetical protein